jgi:rare lipoprotein A
VIAQNQSLRFSLKQINIVSPQRNMNQHRWTCLTTVVLTTVILPIATVHAKTLTSPVMDGGSYSPRSPQSLPIITPLSVTELETEAAIPAAIKPVPQVSKLPIVTPLSVRTGRSMIRQQPQKTANLANLATHNLPTRYPAAQRPKTPSFNPNSQLTVPIFTIPNPIDSSVPSVNPVAPLPQVTAQPFRAKASASFTSQTTSTPSIVVRSDKTAPTVIEPSTTVQAETMPSDRPNAQGSPLATATTRDPELKTFPQVAPIVTQAKDSTDLPSFESGLPVFVFDSERPQQIVATAIAQVDGEIVSSEPSIAIPVERPKQATIPARSPVVAPVPTIQSIIPARSPAVAPIPSIVKIEQPAETTKPALDKIVATHTGKASWYGIEGGPLTANGERYNPNGLTAAHRTLPFGTKVRVTSMKTGKFVTVRINDRGPFRSQRIIDISAGAAGVIGIKNDGIGEVRMEVLGIEG